MRFQKGIHIVLGLGAALSIGQIVRAAVTFLPDQASLINYAIVPTVLLSVIFWVLHSIEKTWKRPLRDLSDLLARVRRFNK